MKIKIGVVMDPINNINIKKDSTFSILLESQKRNYIIYYMEIKDLYIYSNKAYSKTKIINVKKNKKKWFKIIKKKTILLSKLDIILMRKDPPVNMEFIYSTYILEKAEQNGAIVVNKPSSLRNFNEKIFSIEFKKFIPKTLITSKKNTIKKFIKKNKDIIIKPLNGMGGHSIFRVKEKDKNFSVIVETMTQKETKYCISQKYIKEILNGDKRIIIINGIPIKWCVHRIPKKGENRGNIAAGGKIKLKKINKEDLKISKIVGKFLIKKGIILAGIDIIGNKLTEINITSPTCIREIEDFYKISISKILLNCLEKKVLKKNIKNINRYKK
ncbi:glutathione synthase [Buchnera aphidicola (Pseudoregma panicola)]|uniref:glutathione synthase n=1 Tax=Buchnera aphidicola TaxID=9 RepID=UPI0031B6F150